MNASSRSPQSSLNGFYAYKDTFDRDVHWVEIPRNLRFCNITDPYNEEQLFDPDGILPLYRQLTSWQDAQLGHAGTELNTHGLEALSAAALSGVNALHASATPRPQLSPAERGSRRRSQASPAMRGRILGGIHDDGPNTSEQPIDPTLTAAKETAGESEDNQPKLERTEQALGVSETEQGLDLILKSLNQSPGVEAVQRGHKEGEAV